jgi:hypothetical protein
MSPVTKRRGDLRVQILVRVVCQVNCLRLHAATRGAWLRSGAARADPHQRCNWR